MKRLLFLLLILSVEVASGQELTTVDDTLSNEEFNKIINQQFHNLLNGSSTGVFGNFASLDLSETEVTFSPSFRRANGHLIDLKFNGGVSDGIAQVFDNSELSTSFSLDVGYHFLNRQDTQALIFYLDQFEERERREMEIQDTYQRDFLLVSMEQEKNLLLLEKAKNTARKAKLDKQSDEWKNSVPRQPQPRIDSLDYEIKLIEIKLAEIQQKINTMNDPNWSMEKLLEIGNKRADALDSVSRSKLDIAGFRFGWWSIRYKIQRDAFKQFDASQPFMDQVSDTTYTNHEIGLRYSHYRWSSESFETVFFTGGINYKRKSNFNNLSKTEITEVTNHGPNTDDRTTVKKYTAYVGDFKEGINELNLSIDLYYFLFNNNTIAFHFYPSAKYTEGLKPLYNAGFGLLVPFKNKDEVSSIINAELFYDFIDIFHHTDNDLKLFERNGIGLRFTFPISFNPN